MLTEFPHKIVFPWGQDRLVTMRRRAVYPSKGEFTMRCGRCGSTDFTPLVKPRQLGAAKLTTLVCSPCGKLFPLNDKSELGGTLTPETADARKRELINECPDN